MSICPACGQENPDIARFCFTCATPLAAGGAPSRDERRIVSVVFVDLVGFTGRSEALDPEDVRALLNPYHEAVRTELQSFGGVVEKFIGDAVMAVFGAPTAFGDDSERAVRAALAVRDSVASSELELRIAVNTGEALVALGARPERGEAMVAGDVVNTAARLQSAAPVNGVLVGEETWRSTRDAIEYEETEARDAKGKPHPVPAWVAVRPRSTQGERQLGGTFVGRGRELRLLHDIWKNVRDDRTPHLVTIVGPAGTGKTRLGVEFADAIRKQGGLVVRGRSLPYREKSAYGAFASHVKQLCKIFESDSRDRAAEKLHETVESLLDGSAADEVAAHLSLIVGLHTGAQAADRESLFFSVRCFIEAVARNEPTVLVFEDLHWADGSLLDLVELLAERLRDLPILLLVLARPELVDLRPSWGGGLPASTNLPLGPLTQDDARRLALERLAQDADAAREERATELAAAAAGNPLFIEQLAATLTETPATATRALPHTIRGLLAARLDALPYAERSVLLDAAVGGKVFWRGVLREMGTGGERLGELLWSLERRDLIRRETVSAIEGDHQYTFTHMMIRDVAYDLLPRPRRRERHERYARYLERATAEVGEAGAALARHWREAGDAARALEYAVAAAEEAEQGWAKELAVTFYRQALELAGDDAERRRALLHRLAVAEQQAFHLEDARALQERA
ncbi:MAG TPA: AAA family ATPase [Gaiellaceae bacterium]|nr:AAA family ATPase [Gaiellaceae bacterium]